MPNKKDMHLKALQLFMDHVRTYHNYGHTSAERTQTIMARDCNVRIRTDRDRRHRDDEHR